MKALVIGAGLGGLGTGIQLARRGWEVTILEQNRAAGGRMNRINESGFHFDTGPTLLMMPEVLERIFQECGRNPERELPIQRLLPGYEVRFADGAHFRVGNQESTLQEVARLAPADLAGFRALLKDMEAKYTNARSRFIDRPFHGLNDLLHPSTLLGLARAQPTETVWHYISRFVRDNHLRQALTFQTLYLGTSPQVCPAIYGFLPYIEMEFGVWFPRGGMYSIADSLRRLFLELGGKIEYEAPVEEILVTNGRAAGVRTRDGQERRAEAVISNCDAQTTYSRLVSPAYRKRYTEARLRRMESGCSGFLLYLGVDRAPEEWGHHTVLLPENYHGVMNAIFRDRTLPEDPALYICRPSATEPGLAPPGCDSLYVLAPVPHLDSEVDWDTAAGPFRDRCLAQLRRAGWTGIEQSIRYERVWTPPEFRSRYGVFRGSAFGLAHTFLQSAYFRPHNRSEELPGLYLVGASTHPGGGVPIVLTSARLTVDAVIQDWSAQTTRSQRCRSILRKARCGEDVGPQSVPG